MPRYNSISDFHKKVQSGDILNCWPFMGPFLSHGYGVFGFEGKHWKAHRLAYTLAYGPIPDGLSVCHQCDNPCCCNPNHLFLGTTLDNQRDKWKKGRGTDGDRNGLRKHPERAARGNENGSRLYPERLARGEEQHLAKLTDDGVREIRRLHATGRYFQKDLAKMFGVDKATIGRITRRETWKHIT